MSEARMGWSLGRQRAGVALALLALACDEHGGARPSGLDVAGGAGGGAGSGSAVSNSGTDKKAAPPSYVAVFAASSPQSLDANAGGGGAAGAGGAPLPIVAPYGISLGCGDAIVGTNEECDDGPGVALDACTADCKTRDQPAVTLTPTRSFDRYLGAGRHPVSGLSTGFATTYMEIGVVDSMVDVGTPTVGASLFNIWGQLTHHVTVSANASPIDDANPVVAALPDGSFAFAWGDFDGDGSDLGVALRRVSADGTVGPLRAANRGTEFSQLNSDILWTGTQLVVAWEDYANANSAPDLRYRTFDADLNPTSNDVTLAGGELPEAAVALAPFNGGWAAAYREGTGDGKENIVLRSGDRSFRVGPVLGGPLDDRPALVGLDATHLLVVFSAGTDPGLTGTYNVSRLRYAVVDVAGAATQPSQTLDPRFGAYAADANISQMTPSVVPAPDGTPGAYIAWRSEAQPGDVIADQIWLKFATWNATTATLSVTSKEDPIPRFSAEHTGDQRRPELASVGLPPSGALAIAWDDYSHSQGAGAGSPDVVVRYSPSKPAGSTPPFKCTSATLTHNHANHYAVKGEPFVFAATSVCHGPAEYRFVLRRPDGVWIEAQPWGPSPTFNWDTANLPIGGWHAQVWVRDDPSVIYQTYAGTGIILNDYAACTGVSLTSEYPSYGNAYVVIGNTVHFSATAQCAGPARYQFMVAPSGQSYTIKQDWSPNNTFNWDTTGLDIGYWNVLVHVTDAAFYDVSQAYGWNGFMLNHYAACTSGTLISDDPDRKAVAGQIVQWTASSTCDGPAEYRFVFNRPDGTWVEMQPWSANNTFTWDTTGQPLGFWNMQAWVRDAPFYNAAQAYGFSTFVLN
jgi:hypothetical protein